jgi:hypothetical protein
MEFELREGRVALFLAEPLCKEHPGQKSILGLHKHPTLYHSLAIREGNMEAIMPWFCKLLANLHVDRVVSLTEEEKMEVVRTSSYCRNASHPAVRQEITLLDI